ncbi:hypothetical protein B0H14DRAFT_3490284 [Mycena olivaceomarginata]|nr:hypothetical protein B0H14DRAFT_3490284 [Mycena olivaceomarginata]
MLIYLSDHHHAVDSGDSDWRGYCSCGEILAAAGGSSYDRNPLYGFRRRLPPDLIIVAGTLYYIQKSRDKNFRLYESNDTSLALSRLNNKVRLISGLCSQKVPD